MIGGGAFRKVMPFLVAIFVWSYLATKIPVFKAWTPTVTGFHPFGVLTFLGVYIAARTLRGALGGGGEKRWRVEWLILIAVVSGAVCWAGFMHYNSPFALFFAGSLFLLVKKVGVESGRWAAVGKFVTLISPSMFSIYLLHNNTAGLTWLQQAEDYLIRDSGWNYYAACLLVAICIFVGGVLLDLPRRFLGFLWQKTVNK